jgi:flagellar basal body rod protein FlgG
MPDGIAAAASALRYYERRQEIVANNLANADTEGFKAERVFARLIAESHPAPDTATDLRRGAFKETGGALDIATDSDGFFVISTAQGERFSRGGTLQLSPDGVLTDSAGHALLGEKGVIRLGPGAITIDRDGLVAVDGNAIDRLRMETVPPGTDLQHDAGTLFVPGTTRQALALGSRAVRQGFVEESNVNTVSTMVDMISVQRAYANAAKALTTLDGIRATISNDLGRVPG